MKKISVLLAVLVTNIAFAKDIGEWLHDITPFLMNLKNAVVIIVALAGILMVMFSIKKMKNRKKNPDKEVKGVGSNLFIGLIMIGVGGVSYYLQGNEMFKLDHKHTEEVVEEFTLEQYHG
ncbi:hypothetical protein [Vibrio harveyi]|uniref:hypothetical protein n=1 Tax=Vibrio harveyi TaxID=669 RepID=UPI002380809C|nr:hypothetical protein [Vibrio harveyi]